MLRNDVDPLQLSVARIAACEMPRNEPHPRFAVDRDVNDTRHQRLLRMVFSGQVPRDAVPLELLSLAPSRPHVRQGRDIGWLNLSVAHRGHFGTGALIGHRDYSKLPRAV